MKENPSVGECQRMESENDIPKAYDAEECAGCGNFNCIFMPESKYNKLMERELENMFPEGMDDGFDFSDFGEK